MVAGVLNGALVTAEELARSVESWNGRPVPILHPTEDGQPISANWPDIIERTAGQVFNARMDGDRIRAEFWLDEQRMDATGHAPLLAAMTEGQTIEVSTGYVCDLVEEAGEFNGKAYANKHVNLRPDHVALLPGEVGACSIDDGCGAPRINSRAGAMKSPTEILNAIRVAMGLKTNCSCEGVAMNKAQLIEKAKGMVANKTLEAKHLKMLEAMDADQLGMMSAFLDAMSKQQAAADTEPGVEEPPPVEDPARKAAQAANNSAKLPTTPAELSALVANAVATALATELPKVQTTIAANMERATVVARIVANEANAFSAAELNAMSVASLTKYEQSLRPTDFSGAGGGMVANADDKPLVAPAGLVTMCRKQ